MIEWLEISFSRKRSCDGKNRGGSLKRPLNTKIRQSFKLKLSHQHCSPRDLLLHIPHSVAMGWFWGPSDNDDGRKSQSQDPLRNLDPSLRDFLAKESPIKYNTSTPPTPQAPAAPTSTKSPATTSSSVNPSADADTSKAPAQSLYQDGRYAHLWKTYQSQSDAETESKSDQEKINDVLEGYKQRKAEIGRAALENCALEQWQVNECFRNGDWSSRLTLCRTENRELERCYLMQAVSCVPGQELGAHLLCASSDVGSLEIFEGFGLPLYLRPTS